jgi:tryptophan halogenase
VTHPVRRVVVVGRDAALWMAALGLARALGRTGVTVAVAELPSRVEEADSYAAVPSIAGLHRLLGLDEAALLQRCGGVPMTAQRFSSWGQARSAFVHGYDTPGRPGGDLDFVQYWLKARNAGLSVMLEDFSLGAAAAKQGRVPSGKQGTAGLGATAGLQLNARPYVATLRDAAFRYGIEHIPTRSVEAIVVGERLAAVVLDEGRRVEGDLFVDASGSEAVLLGRMPGSDFESWSDWLPCNRILSASAPRLNPLPAFSQISAFRGGWVGLFPLRNRTAVVASFDASAVPEAEVLETLPLIAGVPIQGAALLGKVAAGARTRPWIGNCVALGEAAASLDMLDAVYLHFAHVGLSHLMALFPVDAERMPEAAAYNAAMSAQARNIRDFQAAHYRLNRRYDERLWDRVRDTRPPESLAAKLEVFQARGQVVLYDHETFQEQDWASMLIGHGLMPRSYDPRVDMISAEEHMAKVRDRLSSIAADVRSMPPVEAYLSAATSGVELVS